MLFVVDSNEFIFALGQREKASKIFLETLCVKTSPHKIHIPRTVFEEVKRNLSPETFREFIELLSAINIVVNEDIVVPFELGLKYKTAGLKPADAFIAAYAEWTGANALVTENRHFLLRQIDLPFKVINAEKCLKFIKSSRR